ncbi:MAG: response regulator [Proteobacteria bacterium]|nr:response regulator [Pseudomonadota bacterium]
MERTPEILLVDDEADFRRPLVKRLTKRGFSIREAGDGREALAVLDQARSDVVVMDVKMPVMDGLTALARIKSAWPETEVILLTGHATTQDGVEGIKAGAFDYLSKPLELDHLAGKITQAWEKIVRTEEKKREQEFRAKMEQRMIATERLASLGTLATGVAHEINNPLAVISESAGWLKTRLGKETALPDEARDKFLYGLNKIESSVERAKRITHQLLGFARKTDSLIKEVDLAALAAEVIDLTRKSAEDARARAELRPIDGRIDIWTDPNQLRQVLINLVTNGLQAVGPGGSVRVAVETAGSEIVITVADDGPGIPGENLDRIFEPFFSTKPPGQGTGLGLSVSRGIVEKMGGRIEVESRLGNGATFRVILPIKPINNPDQAGAPVGNSLGS